MSLSYHILDKGLYLILVCISLVLSPETSIEEISVNILIKWLYLLSICHVLGIVLPSEILRTKQNESPACSVEKLIQGLENVSREVRWMALGSFYSLLYPCFTRLQ